MNPGAAPPAPRDGRAAPAPEIRVPRDGRAAPAHEAPGDDVAAEGSGLCDCERAARPPFGAGRDHSGRRYDFARFMEIALYAPGVGYYAARAAVDFQRDYVTSPELHPAFGVLLCGQLEEMWRRMGRPGEFWLVEGGPGTGAFASDVLATAEEGFPDFSRALRLALIERSDALRDVQRATLAPWGTAVRWVDLEAGPGPLGAGCVFGNELLDALPAHRVVMRAEGLHETYVSTLGNGFEDVEDLPSTPALAEQIRAGWRSTSFG